MHTNTPGEIGNAGQCTKQCAETYRIGFMAGLSENFDIQNNSITFDTVVTDVNSIGESSGYDANTGHFSAPADGIYSFHVHALQRNLKSQIYIVS